MKTLQDKADIVDGKQAKELNLLCDKFTVAKVQYDCYKKEKDSLTTEIKNNLECHAGRYITNKYELLITTTDDGMTVDLKKLQEIEPTLFEQLISKYPKVTKGNVTLKSVKLRGKEV